MKNFQNEQSRVLFTSRPALQEIVQEPLQAEPKSQKWGKRGLPRKKHEP